MDPAERSLPPDVYLRLARARRLLDARVDMTMDGFRWLTVGSPRQPDLEIVLMEPKPGPMLDPDAAREIRQLLEKGMLGAGVFETDDCRATYDELRG
jgi:hypothetical protein